MPDSNITKKILAKSFQDLLEEKSFSKISVADICEKCQMNRKSFYYHFKDKYDLVNWIYYTDFFVFIQRREGEAGWDLLEEFCDFFYNNKEFYRKTFTIEGQNSFSEYFKDIIMDIVQYDLNIFLNQEDNQNKEFYTIFYTDAITCAIKRWLTQKDCVSGKEFCQLLKSCVLNVSSKIIDEYSS